MRALILFDIDGTLLITGGASSRCIRRAAAETLGPKFQWSPVTVGTLDQQIFHELAARCGIENASSSFGVYKARYIDLLTSELRERAADITLMPGVREALNELSRRHDVVIGLLTGNFEQAARIKIEMAGLDPTLFRANAFAEDGERRTDLVPAACARWKGGGNTETDPRRVILVGDTPRDIECARQAGCRVVAVATGHYSLDDLAALRPDRAIKDLTQRAALYDLIDETLE